MLQLRIAPDKAGELALSSRLDATSFVYNQARDSLTSARLQLSQSLKTYLDACRSMEIACGQPQACLNQDVQGHSAVELEFSACHSEMEVMKQALYTLLDTKNRLKMTALIYRLPIEVLTRILLHAACHCPEPKVAFYRVEPSASPIVLSSVCRLWRKIALGCTPLWTHLDLVVGGHYDELHYYSPEIWSERSRGNPIHVHVREHILFYPQDSDDGSEVNSTSKAADDAYFAAASIRKLLRFLVPLLPQVSSVFVSLLGQQDLLGSLLENWMDFCVVPKRRIMQVHNHLERNSMRLEPSNFVVLDKDEHWYYKNFFSPLEVLDLRNTLAPWRLLSLPHLVELRIEAGEDDSLLIMQEDITAVLSTCPKLRSFIMVGMRIEAPDEPTPRPHPITLSDLRVLTLREITVGNELEFMLSIINPGKEALDMCITIPQALDSIPGFLREWEAFMSRSNVVSLHVKSYLAWFATQLGPLPNVHTLAFNSCQLSDVMTRQQKTQNNPNPIDLSSNLWPRLQKLYLYHCGLEVQHVYKLVSLCPIQKLYLRSCYEDRAALIKLEDVPEKIREYQVRLSNVVPIIVWYQEHSSPAVFWPFETK